MASTISCRRGPGNAQVIWCTHTGASPAEGASDTGGGAILLFGDGHDVALGLALDDQVTEGVTDGHHPPCRGTHQDDIGSTQRFGQWPVGNGIGSGPHHRDGRKYIRCHPSSHDRGADVGPGRRGAQVDEPVGQAAHTAVPMILGSRGEGAIHRMDPEHAPRRDAARSAIRGGVGHGGGRFGECGHPLFGPKGDGDGCDKEMERSRRGGRPAPSIQDCSTFPDLSRLGGGP